MSKFAVTLNYHGNYGYVEYDSENKKAEIVLGVAEAKAKVEKFLNEKLTLDVQEGDTVRQFVTTDVLVEWSMPPGMTENL